MGFFDDLTGGNIITAALPTAINVVAGLFGQKAQQEAADKKAALEQQRYDEKMALEREALAKAGGGGAQGPDRQWQLAQLYQDQASQNQESGNLSVSALSQLGNSIAQAYLSGSKR